jgi:hypothetical protein
MRAVFLARPLFVSFYCFYCVMDFGFGSPAVDIREPQILLPFFTLLSFPLSLPLDACHVGTEKHKNYTKEHTHTHTHVNTHLPHTYIFVRSLL